MKSTAPTEQKCCKSGWTHRPRSQKHRAIASRSLAVLSSDEEAAGAAAGVVGGGAEGGDEAAPAMAATAESPTPAVERTAASFSIV